MNETDPAERRTRYAAAMAKRDGHPEWPPQFEDDERNYLRRADAAITVADGEQAELCAENAELHRYHDEDRTALAETRATIERLRGQKQELGELAARRESELIHCRAQLPAAVPPVPAGTDLRDRIAHAIEDAQSPQDWSNAEELADAVLATLPTPTDRAAVLREAADAVARFTGNDLDANAKLLRRMADEEQQTEAHPAEHTWAAELHDPLADEWVPGTRYPDRDRAMNALVHGQRIGPTWKDGTPTQRRIVRATTTYTVEPT